MTDGYRYFRLLVRAGSDGIAAAEIARKLDILPNTLSARLTVLSYAQLVRSRREGRSIIYFADYGRMAKSLGFLVEDCCNGKPAICAPLAEAAKRAACCVLGDDMFEGQNYSGLFLCTGNSAPSVIAEAESGRSPRNAG